jgi:hypothetical protein
VLKELLGKILTRNCFHNPIFIIGASRSGTSVLLQALGKHPKILSMSGEAPFITSMGGAVHLFEFAENRDFYLQSIKVTKDYLYNSFRRLSFEVAAGNNYGLKMIVKDILCGDLSLLWKRYWCAKTFPDYAVSKSLMQLYPKGKFVYIVRNGCSVVQSMTKFSGFREQSFEKNCRSWAESVEKYRYLLTLESAIVARHEQLVEDPKEIFQKIFSFIGAGYNEKPADFIKTVLVHPLDSSTKTGVDVKNVLNARKPPYENWSSEHRDLFKNICGNGMRALGYEIPF